jgi:hypothetical protein
MARHDVRLLVCVLALGVCLLAAPAGAGAGPVPSGATLVTDGEVRALAVDGSGRTYLGGSFSQLGSRVGHGLKLTGSDDQPVGGFPDVNGTILAVVSDGSGGWFIGGDFTAVGGAARNRLAHIRSDGSVDPTWNPNANDTVRALALSGSDLYVGGRFSGAGSIGGQDRNRIARLSTTGSGAADPTWNPDANGQVFALALSGSDLYVGGDFLSIGGELSIGGQARNGIAKLSTTGSGAADPTWNPNAKGTVVALAVAGTDLFVGGSFSGAGSIGGQGRNRIARLSTTGSGAADPTWNPDADGSVWALACRGLTSTPAGTSARSVGSSAPASPGSPPPVAAPPIPPGTPAPAAS